MDFTTAFATERKSTGEGSGTTDEHTLTIDEIPARTHLTVHASDGAGSFVSSRLPTAQRSNFAGQSHLGSNTEYHLQSASDFLTTSTANAGQSSSAGGGEAHSHGLSSTVSVDMDLDVKYVHALLCEKL